MFHASIRENLDFKQNSRVEFYTIQTEAEKLFESRRYRVPTKPSRLVDTFTQEVLPGDCSEIQRVAHTALSLNSEQASLTRVLSASAAMCAILPSVSVSNDPPIPQELEDARDVQELVGTAEAPGTFIQLADSVWNNLEERLKKEKHSVKEDTFSNFNEVFRYWGKIKKCLFHKVKANKLYGNSIHLFERCLILVNEKDRKEEALYSFQFFEIFFKNNFIKLCPPGAQEVVIGLEDYCRSLGLSVRNGLSNITCNAAYSFRRDFIRSIFQFSDAPVANAMEVHYYAATQVFYSDKFKIKEPDEPLYPDLLGMLEAFEKDVNSPSRKFWEKWYTLDNLITVVANALEGNTGSDDDQKKIDLSDSDRMWWRDLYQMTVAYEEKAYFFQNEDEIHLKGRYIALANDSKSDLEAWEHALLTLQNATSENAWKCPLATVSSFQEEFKKNHEVINRIITFALHKDPSNPTLKSIKKIIFSPNISDVERFESLSDLRDFLKENTTLPEIVKELAATLSVEQRAEDRIEVSKKLNAFDWDSWVCNNTFETFREATWNTSTNMPTRYGALILLLENGLIRISDEKLSYNSPYESFLKAQRFNIAEKIKSIKCTKRILFFIINDISLVKEISDAVLLQDGVLSTLIDSTDKFTHIRGVQIFLERILAIEGTLPAEIIIKIIVKFSMYLDKFPQFPEKIPDRFELEEGVFEKLIANADPSNNTILKSILALKGTLSDGMYYGVIKKFGPYMDAESWKKIVESFLRRGGGLEELIDRALNKGFMRNACIVRRILELDRSDKVLKKILKKFGPYLEYKFLKDIPDKLFLESDVWPILMNSIDTGLFVRIDLAQRILKIQDTLPDATYDRILRKFGPVLDDESWKKIVESYLRREGVLEEWLASEEKRYYGFLHHISGVRRIFELEIPLSDKILKKIIKIWTRHIEYKFLKEIPDRIFLDSDVWSSLMDSICTWRADLAQRIVEIQGTLPGEIIENIVQGSRLYDINVESCKKIAKIFLQRDGVREKWIARTEKNLNTILNNIDSVRRIFELEIPVSDKIHKKIIKIWAPHLEYKVLKEIPDRFFLESEVWSSLMNSIDTDYVYYVDNAIAERILEIQGTLLDGDARKFIKRFGTRLNYETLKKISDVSFLQDGVLSSILSSITLLDTHLAKRVLEVQGTLPDGFVGKIVVKCGMYLDYETLKKIPDSIFLEREVWSDLINTINFWDGGLARRILEIQDDLPAGALEKIVKEHRQDLDWEGLSDSALLRDGVLSTVIDGAEEWCPSIPKRILEMPKPLPSWAVTKCIKKFGPYLDFDSICRLCLNADSLEPEMIELLDLEKIRKEKPDILENLGNLNPNVYSKLKNLSTNEMKILVKNKPELAKYFKYANKVQEISVHFHAGKIMKSFVLLFLLPLIKTKEAIKNALRFCLYCTLLIVDIFLKPIKILFSKRHSDGTATLN